MVHLANDMPVHLFDPTTQQRLPDNTSAKSRQPA